MISTNMTIILCGDALAQLATLEAQTVQTCVTSPPYWGLRDYGVEGQLGLEKTPEEYVAKMVAVFREVRRVLKDDGTLWLNLGDTYSTGSGGTDTKSEKQRSNNGTQLEPRPAYNGLATKNLVGIPWRVAFALQADGWYLRSDIIWHKPNPMPESVTDRPTKSHEYIFLMSKSERYYYDAEAIKEDSVGRELFGNSRIKGYCEQRQDNERQDMTLTSTRNRRSVWTVATQPYPEAHFATFPPKLIEPCILAGAPAGGVVLDPFMGSGTTLFVAKELGRRAVGIELNPAYCVLAEDRLAQEVLAL